MLDFLNTRPVQNGELAELLPDFSALLHWFQAAGVMDSGEAGKLHQQWGQSARARRAVAALRAVREELRKAIQAWESSGVVPGSTLNELNRLMAKHPMRARLKANAGELSTGILFRATTA